MSRPKRGPYGFGQRLRWLLARGRIYLSRNPVSGLPALLEVPTGETPERVPTGAVQVLVTTYAGESPATALELRAGRPEHVHNALDLVASMAESALDEPDVRAHLATGSVVHIRPPVVARQPVAPPARIPQWMTGIAAAGVLFAVCWPRHADNSYVERPRPMEFPSPLVVEAPLPAGDASTLWMTDLLRSSSSKESMTIGRVRLPDEPLPGQDTPPCPRGYMAINNGCWAKLDAKAPDCPKGSAEHKGGCYLPIKGEKPVPMSVDRAVGGGGWRR